MNLQEFINKYEGGSLCNDYGCQCVKLAKVFSEEVLWIKLWYFGWSAIEWFENNHNTFPAIQWSKFLNTPEWIPEEWSLIFFKWESFSKYWHVAIVIEANVNVVKVLEQNGWAWGWGWLWGDAIRKHTYEYSQVEGWITADKVVEPDFYQALEDYSNWHIVVLYNSKYYINLRNKRVEINKYNFDELI